MARPSKHDGVVYPPQGNAVLVDAVSGPHGHAPCGIDRHRRLEGGAARNYANDFRPGTTTSSRSFARASNSRFRQWAELFLENYSKPPSAQPKTHEANDRARHAPEQGIRRSASWRTCRATRSKAILRHRLRQRVQRKTKAGIIEKGRAQAVHGSSGIAGASAHAECRRSQEAAAGEPVLGRGVSREGERVVPAALRVMVGAAADRVRGAEYLRNVVRIITETGLRVYKELAPMKKDQVDLENAVVWIPDSKTPNGVAEVPLTDLAVAGVSGSDANRGGQPVSVSQRREPTSAIRRRSRRSGG